MAERNEEAAGIPGTSLWTPLSAAGSLTSGRPTNPDYAGNLGGSMPTVTPWSWRQSVTQEERSAMAHNFVSSIWLLATPAPTKHQIYRNLEAYARKLEDNLYRSANSRKEYYQLMAEKIRISKEEIMARKLRYNHSQGGAPSRAVTPSSCSEEAPLEG